MMKNYREGSTGGVYSAREVKKRHSNVSFSSVVDTFKDLGYDEVLPTDRPDLSSPLKKHVAAPPVKSGSDWIEDWAEEDIFSGPSKAADEAAYLQRLNDEKAVKVRIQRDGLLRDSDHTQLDDTPQNKVQWKNYRAELRDIPNQPGFPDSITWPDEPT